MGTMEGLSVPIYGAFYKYSAAQVQAWYVEDDGTLNMSFTNPGPDNCLALTITDGSTANTSGYIQGIYVSMTTSSGCHISTGNSQVNAIAVDMFIGGDVDCEVEGLYIYIAAGSSPVLTGGDVSGIAIYIDDLATTAAYAQCLFLHYANATAPGQSSYIMMKGEGGYAPSAALLFHRQTPAYFVKTIVPGSPMVASWTCGGTQDKVLVCNIYGSTYWIPLYAASA